MNYMYIEGTIASIVETMLPRFSSEELALHMILDFSFHNRRQRKKN